MRQEEEEFKKMKEGVFPGGLVIKNPHSLQGMWGSVDEKLDFTCRQLSPYNTTSKPMSSGACRVITIEHVQCNEKIPYATMKTRHSQNKY